MLDTAIGSHGLTRRNFLKTTGVAAGALSLGSLAGCSAEEEETTTEETVTEEVYFQGCGGNCSIWGCPFYVHVREGKVANITKPGLTCPDESPSPYQEVCCKGYANIERMYSETRVQYPMRRVEGTERGAGEWERITWDEAIEEITTKWTELQEEYGPQSVAFMTCSGAMQSTIIGGWPGRLQKLMGAMTVYHCFDQVGIYATVAYYGWSSYFLMAGQSEARNIPYAKNVFIWGTNPTESLAAEYHFISEAKENGAKLIVIDPIFTTSASKADMYVPIRPGTDGLLAAGMTKIAIRDGFVDKASLQMLSVAPCLVKDSDGLYLRLSDIGQAEAGSEEDAILAYEAGQPVALNEAIDPEIEGSFEVEGIAVKPAYQILLERLDEWSLDTIAEYTEVSLETIEELAALYLSDLSIILPGYGLDHYANAHTAYDAIYALANVTGQVSKLGTGIAFVNFTPPKGQGVINTGSLDLDDYSVGPTVYSPHFHELMEVGHLGEEGQSGVVSAAPKAIYIYAGNPIGNTTERLKWLESFDQFEQIVVADMFMSQTAQVADIVLPAAFLFEHADLCYIGSPFVKLSEQASDPLFEAKSDFDIISLLGKGMGFGEFFTSTLDEYLESCVTNDYAAAEGVTYERLQEDHAIWSYPEEPVISGLNIPISTATGRMEFYHEGIQPQANVGQEWDMVKESCWYWEPPLEAWHENELYETYPLHLLSERSKFKTHTQFNDIPMLLEIDSEPVVKVNPVDAEARNIVEGDIVRLYNNRGDVALKAIIDSSCRPGCLVTIHGWEADDFVEGHYNNLTTHESWARYEQANFFDCLCQMEKY